MVAKKGFDHLMGARPMARVIQEHLKKANGGRVAIWRLVEKGGEVKVTVKGEIYSYAVKLTKTIVGHQWE